MSAWRFLTTLPHRRTGEHHTVPIISVEAYRSERDQGENIQKMERLCLRPHRFRRTERKR